MLLPCEHPSVPGPRRRALRWLASVAAVAAGGLQTACKMSQAQPLHSSAFSFAHGVASGDPLSDALIIWTRVTPQAHLTLDEDTSVLVGWQVASDAQMTQIVASGNAQTSAAQDFTVKVDVTGLQPGQEYFYRFMLGMDGGPGSQLRYSPQGRGKTLPLQAEQVKLAVFSCSNYPAGFFNVYADACGQEVDAALHLGDYIYEYEADGYASGKAAQLGRLSEPRHALHSLSDYRRRYAQYRSDPDLQAVHAHVSFICIWDDHEFADDTWREGAEDHDDLLHGPFSLRRNAAITAWYEWLPVRMSDPSRPERIYRSFEFADILSLHMLDTRVIGRDQQLQFSSYCHEDGDDKAQVDVPKLKRDAHAAKRQMLGKEQFSWLSDQVGQSQARWQVLGQQVLMTRMEFPLPVACGAVDRFEFVKACAQARQNGSSNPLHKEWLHAARVPCYLDSWDGYQAERERVFALMQSRQKNLVVLTGDSHNAWASDLQDQAGRAVGVEFATASVSSPGMEGGYPQYSPQQVAACMQALMPNLRYAQTSRRGYLLINASRDEFKVDFRFVDTVLKRQFHAQTECTLRTLPGQRKISQPE